jgi:uncharacterized membrane protein YoaT (DUF817 family)
MLSAIDNLLMNGQPRQMGRLRRVLLEFIYFGIKEARACLFVVLFFAAVLLMPRSGIAGIPRYDMLLVVALVIQFWMVRAGSRPSTN